MQPAAGITDIAHGIQLAVAPVFLLSAVGSVLAVLTNRLARIIDRARLLERDGPGVGDTDRHLARAELLYLSQRAKYIHTAITLSTTCALVICVVIVTLFVGVALGKDLSGLIVILFILGLLAFIAALISFLLEIRTATASIRFGNPTR
jgi:hypothetical protein